MEGTLELGIDDHVEELVWWSETSPSVSTSG